MRDFASVLLKSIPWSVRDRIKSIPYLGELQRAIVSRLLDGHEFDHRVDAGPAKGITFAIRMPEDKGIWTGTYEVHFATRLAAELKPGAVAYDIGSWHGFFTGVMAAQGASQVHAFEPLPQNAERIRRLVALNPGRPITLHVCAVGERDTEMDLLVTPETSMARLEANTFHTGETSDTRVRVKVRSIDSIVAAGAASPPTLIKIDVEGAEAVVLAGARETIRRHRPIIFAEVHSSALLEQCKRLLKAAGYRIEQIKQDAAGALAKDMFQIKATPAQPS